MDGLFDPDAAYADATLGWYFPGRASFEGVVRPMVPNWGAGRSYLRRVVGDESGAIVMVVDTPELFGAEIRTLSVVDFGQGAKIVRFVDYWDGRHFGAERAAHMRTPAAGFPSDLGESRVSTSAGRMMTDTVDRLAAALAAGSPASAAAVFTDDAVFEDWALHTQLAGRRAIERYLERTGGELPYARDVTVAHVVGSDAGGGYEWRAETAVRNGVVALELDAAGLISRLTTVWDASRLPDDEVRRMTLWSVEPS